MKKDSHRPPLPSESIPYPVNMDKFKDPKELKRFKKSETYKKYIVPIIKSQKQRKREMRANWWAKNWINVLTLIVSLLSLIATVIFGLLQLQYIPVQ